ncbi:MAG: hypothetical protein IH957_02060 [Chloroflexi bacterium]|nr:hypothetical protein [Chloroflexota bacterium]
MTRLAVSRYIVTISVAFLAAVLGAFLIAGSPHEAAADEPEITFQYPPPEGGVYAETLQVIQICFAQPVDVRDKPPAGDGAFEFDIDRPDGLGLGMRIVFQANGYGVAIYPGLLDEGFEGPWALNFEVRDAGSLDVLSGRLAWEIQTGGDPVITPTPAVCPTSGDPPSTPIDDPDGTPGASESPDGTDGLDEDDDVDVLKLVLLTLGAVGGAGVIALIGYLIRNRVGFWLHRPPEDDGSADDEH